MAYLARAVVSWSSVAAAALLSMLLGLALTGTAHATPAPDGLIAGESGESHFGQSVALSADGDTALVGAPTANGEAGAVLVFTRTGSTWTQQAELTPASGEEIGNGGFGSSVALSAEGNTAVIGAPGDNGGAGAAWVFTRSEAGVWTQQGAKLTPEIGEESLAGAFGSSVALSSEGDTALIGGPGDNGGAGAAWVFTRAETGVWTEQGAKLTAKAGEETGSGAFGSSVALSKDGATALIGAPGDSGKAGAVWAFTRSEAGVWSQQGEKLMGGGEVGEGLFGSSVALSKNGDTALIGGPADGEPLRGAAWAFTRSEAGAWAQQGEKLTAKTGEESEAGAFGSSVALSADGNTALIGGPGDDEDTGAAWMLARASEGVWAQEGMKLTAKAGEESEAGAFGSSVALSADGYTELVGGPADDTNTGAVWAFVNPPTVSGVSPDKGPEAGGTSVTITGTNLSEAAAVEFGSISASSFEVTSPTSITAIAPAGTSTVDVTVTTSGGASATGSADEFTYVPAPAVVTQAASLISQTTATLNATVNPNGGEVTSCKFEYGTTEIYESSAPCSTLPGSGTEPVAVSASLENLSASTTYYFRIVATNLGGTSTDILDAQTFKTLPNAPTVVTEEASSIAQITATLNATVNPNGGEVSSCMLEYGPTQSYGSSAACSPSPGSGNSAVAVSAAVTGLSANTTYHFRVVATNPGGTSSGADQTFKTLPNAPTVVTEQASFPPAQTLATINATVNPNGGEVTNCHFDYGTTSGYGHEAPCSSLPGSGTSAVAVSALLSGLSPNTLYYFRIVATNAGGTSTDTLNAQTFETAPGPPMVVAEGATEIKPTTAILNATANLLGGKISQCYFNVFDSQTGERVFSRGCTQPRDSGTVKISALAEELSPETSYYFTVDVENNFEERSFGESRAFKTAPGPGVVTGVASSITQTSAKLNATVNPNGDEVENCKFEYGTSTPYEKSVPCSPSPGSGTGPVEVSAPAPSLDVNTTYHFRIIARNSGGVSLGADHTFSTLPNPPTVVTGAASSIAQTTASLKATVNPNGGEVRIGDCRLEYGTSTSYGSSAACSTGPESGSSPVEVSAAVAGLSANTTYHFRVVATNAGGPSLPGTDQTFTTLPNAPTVLTEKASSVTQTTATLNATVNPNGGSVSSCELEYGISASYGSSVSCTPSPGSGNSAVAVSASLRSLSASTTYHFRVVATNPGGKSEGAAQTLRTTPVPTTPPITTPTETTLATTNTKTATTTTSPSTTPKTLVATCRVSLASTSVMAQTGDMAAIKLIWTGTSADTCSGKLTLTVKTKGKSKRPKPTLIGTGAFSLPFGKTQIARVKLNEAGRALLNAGHGRLSANLAILELFPDPSQAQTETVHLAREARSSNVRKK